MGVGAGDAERRVFHQGVEDARRVAGPCRQEVIETAKTRLQIGTGGIDLLDCLAERLSTSRASVVLMGSPFGSTREAPPPGGYLAEEETTHLLPLPGTFDRYWEETLTTSKRNDVRRCSKKGVRIRIGGSDEEIRAVYRFYRQSFSRWGASPDLAYPEALYRAMVRLGGGHVRLYIAEADGRIIGGAFVPSWNGHVHYHAGYFDHGARSLRPNVLIQVEIVRHAIEEGQKDYDFLPSGGKPGVEAFKEGFGGTRTPVRRLSRQGVPHRLLARLRGRPRPQPGG